MIRLPLTIVKFNRFEFANWLKSIGSLQNLQVINYHLCVLSCNLQNSYICDFQAKLILDSHVIKVDFSISRVFRCLVCLQSVEFYENFVVVNLIWSISRLIIAISKSQSKPLIDVSFNFSFDEHQDRSWFQTGNF